MPRYPEEWSRLKVVLCHDWLTGMRGGERVLEILCEAFPRAPIFTLIHNPAAISPTINAHPVTTSWLQRIPGIAKRYRHFLPLFPSAIERLRAPPCDLLISTSHCIAKALPRASATRHLCYCFTPMRYAWTFYEEYFGNRPLQGAIARPLIAALRRWDRATCPRVDRFVAISRHVAQRIRDFYERDADVVYPPVDTAKWTPGRPAEDGRFDLIVSALVPYKRLDLAVRTYSKLGYPLRVVGVGGELDRLQAMAAANVEFLGWRPDPEVLALYQSCRCLIFPGEEDFGLVPLEAQSCGKPVVAFGKGGVVESVKDGETGVFFAEQTEDSLADAVTRCAARSWDPARIRANAERFSVQTFIDGLAESIRSVQ